MEGRILYVDIWRELAAEKNMVFLAGPRQCGKTTLIEIISESFTNKIHFNWDIAGHRARLIENPTFFETLERRDASLPLVVFDEIHKYRDWKNYLKGVYDQFHARYQFLVSGSGRLDIYQRGGDSLAGGYYLFHLWPFTVAELGRRRSSMETWLREPLKMTMEKREKLWGIWQRLSTLSGFPEPFLSNRIRTYRRWTTVYSQQLIREDIRDLTAVKSVGDLELLYELLPSRVGSPISIPSLAGDLRVSYNSVRAWLLVFERFFLIISITPWTQNIARAIQKERKIYLFDSPRIEDASARFENMVALDLWRAVTSWNDMGYGSFSLHFIKNKEKQEVDFLIANKRKPFLLVESKLTDMDAAPALKKFQRALNVPAVQLVEDAEGYRILSNERQSILVAPAYQWLSHLP